MNVKTEDNASCAFPPGFLWGTATSSHQVEGGNSNNNWWRWEQQRDRILDGSRSGRACGWAEGLWRDDLDRAAAAGQNAHRCSLEWSRLQPAEGVWDEQAVRFYRELLEGMLARGLRPFVTLHHYTEPQWFSREGGWLGKRALRHFESYASGVMERFGDYCNDWCTFNEPNALVLQSYVGGTYPPGGKNVFHALRAAGRIAAAHAAAYRIIHAARPASRAGIVILYYDIQPLHPERRRERGIARLLSHLVNDFFINAAVHGRFPRFLPFRDLNLQADALDFIGLNYYTGVQLGWTWRLLRQLGLTYRYPPAAERSATGLIACYPEGFHRALDWAAFLAKPVVVTENGIDDTDDVLRPRYIVAHLREIAAAIGRGIPIEGYFHWSLVDNFEWDKGWTHRFGLWAMDPDTLQRTARGSAALYEDICRENGLTDNVLRRHAALLAKDGQTSVNNIEA